MTDNIIFSFVPVVDTSMIASVRIARYLKKALKMDAVWGKEIGEMRDLDTLVIVNGAYGFSKHLEALSHAILGARQIIWVQNDYTIVPPSDSGTAESPFRKAFVTRKQRGDGPVKFWSTCHKWSSLPDSHYVNWNQLTYDMQYSEDLIKRRRKNVTDTLLYYGSFRSNTGMRKTKAGPKPFIGKNGRDEAFATYFTAPYVPTVVSSPAPQFAEKFPNITCVPAYKSNFFDTIGSHGLGLYIEDVMSHEQFHSPANRFYEMLSAGLPMVFEPRAVTQMAKAGYDIKDFIAEKPTRVRDLMHEREAIGKKQRKLWAAPAEEFAARLKNELWVARKAAGL